MARAMARGWGDPVLCSDGGSGRASALVDELGGEALESNVEVARRADLVFLCHKPAQLKLVADEIRGEARAVASVLGGVSIGALEDAYPGIPVVRLMPNTPVEVRRGVVCYAAGAEVTSQFERDVVELLGRLGVVIAMHENSIAAAAAVMSVTPAYHALITEAQVDAAVRHGLNPRLASRLVVDTAAGTAALLEARDYDTLAVRREVTSPGGITAKGLDALERAGIRSAFQSAIDAILLPGAAR
jgi:pyrroline-5-carboxylate reductase